MARIRKDRVDENQGDIVKELRKLPGVTVEVGHDDILVGYGGLTRWYEIKDPEKTKSKKTGELLKGAIKDDQQRIVDTFTGHYKIVFSFEDILLDMGYCR